MSRETTEAIGKNYPEGLLVAIAKNLAPDPNMPEIIGNLTLSTLSRVFGESFQPAGPLRILIAANPSPRPQEIEMGANWDAGQVFIRLPEQGRHAVQQVNASLLQNVAAGAVIVESARRATTPLTGDVFQRFAQIGSDACAQILQEINERVRAQVGEGVELNLLPEPPEVTSYDFLAALGIHRSSSENV